MVFVQPASPALPVTPAIRPVSEGGRRILDLILKSDSLSQAAITRTLDLAQPTVARLLQGFHQDGMIQMAHRHVDRPGHPSVNVSLNPDFAYAFGLSMMGDMLSMTLMDFTGKIRAERRAAMPTMSQAAVLERLTAFKPQILEAADVDARRVVGAGVGISGFFTGERNWINPPAYLQAWSRCDIEPILEDALGLPVMIDNDGNTAAVGESLFGVGRRCNSFAYLHLTNGFGGGVIADGKPYRGHNGNAGEFGGALTLIGGPYPNLDLLQSCVRDHGHDFATVEDMVAVIDAAWPGVSAWIDLAAPQISRLADIIGYCLDPQVVVVGGRLPQSISQALIAKIALPRSQPSFGGRAPAPAPQVVAAELTGDPSGIGAAAMPLRRAFFA